MAPSLWVAAKIRPYFVIPKRKIFVVAQLAVSMALLMATGLLVRALRVNPVDALREE